MTQSQTCRGVMGFALTSPFVSRAHPSRKQNGVVGVLWWLSGSENESYAVGDPVVCERDRDGLVREGIAVELDR